MATAVATKAASVTTARFMRPDEPVPDSLNESLLFLRGVDRRWIWLAEHNEEIIGCLIAAPCHGIAMIIRVKMVEGAPRSALLILLRQFFADLRERSYEGFMSWYDESSEDEKALRDIAEKFNGIIVARPGVAIASRLPPEGT